MIPKTIHYCWFGKNPLPQIAVKCIESWKKYAGDFQIVEWNEDNFDVSQAPEYVKQAYQEKRWAFVSDYARLKVVYDNGGIYLDTDVELVRSIDKLLDNNAYFAMDQKCLVASGLGFGAVKGAPILLDIMKQYETLSFFNENREPNPTPCPITETAVLKKHGLQQTDSVQTLENSVVVFPWEYFDPMDRDFGKIKKTRNTYSIHHYSALWKSEEEQKKRKEWVEYNKKERLDSIKHLPNRILKSVFGEKFYQHIKTIVKRHK